MGNPRVVDYPKGDYDFEVVLKSGEIVYTHPDYSFSDLNENMYDEDCVDRISTLSSHYEPGWIQKNDLEILNDRTVYQMPLRQLFSNYMLYDYIKRKYGENSR